MFNLQINQSKHFGAEFNYNSSSRKTNNCCEIPCRRIEYRNLSRNESKSKL